MTINATWNISGIKLDNSINAYIKSAQIATQSKTLKKYQPLLNKNFKEYIRENMLRSGVDADNLSDVFSLNINNGNINFVNTEPLITQRYEYGYYEDDTTNKTTNKNSNDDDYYEEYIIQTSPRYFIRPAIEDSLRDVGIILLNEAKKEYNQNHGNEMNEEQK